VKKYLAVFGKPRYLGIISCEEELVNGERYFVQSVRGEDIAISVGLLNEEQETTYRALRNTVDRGENTPKTTEPAVTDLKYIRKATDKDLNEQMGFRTEEKEILKTAKQLVIPHELDMKLIDVEYLAGKQKLFLYFSADQRVDFRAYVRDLAREFRTRIELRQVGVRDEAKIVGGIGLCGHVCCCSYWLHQFAPVGIKMVKEQNLALNPTKISGICGRLMCCMCYEENVYHELWEGMPNPGTKIKSDLGTIVVSGIDVAHKALKCFIPEHGEKDIPICKFDEFQKAVTEGKEWESIEELIATDDRCEHCRPLDASIFSVRAQSKILRSKQDNLANETEKEQEDSPKRRFTNFRNNNRQHEKKDKQQNAQLTEEHEEQNAKTAHRRNFHKRHRINRKHKNETTE